MAKKLKAIREVVMDKDVTDIQGWTLKKGQNVFIMNESLPKNPRTGVALVLIRVDNGTGHLDLCQETCINETDLPKK